jgi:hypothetical protein
VEGYVPQRREILNKIKEAIESGKPYDIEYAHAQAISKKIQVEVQDEAEVQEEEVVGSSSDEEEEEEVEEEEEEIEQEEDEEQKARETQYERELQAEISGKSFEADSKSAKKKVKRDPEEEKKILAEMMLTKKEKGRYLFHVGKQRKRQRAADALIEKRKLNEEGAKKGTKKAKSHHDDE